MDFSSILAFAAAALAGALLLSVGWQERRSIAHWAFVAGLAVLASESFFYGLSVEAVSSEKLVYWQYWRLFAASFFPGVWLFFSLSYARGNSREFLVRWRFVLAVAFLAPVSVAISFRDRLTIPTGETGAGYPPILGLGAPAVVLNLIFLLSAILVLMNLERTFRFSAGTMRWRIKFMLLGVGLVFAARAYSSSQALLFRAEALQVQAIDSGALLVACLLFLVSFARARQFEVNVYPSHAVLQNSLTVLVAGIYLFMVGALAKVVTFLGGDAGFQLKAFLILLSLVLLTIFLLSEKMRLRVRHFVSRHFQRPLHDYRTVWRTFTEGTASHVVQADLCRAAVRLLSEIFQALSVTIWLVDDRKEKLVFVASTSLADSTATRVKLDAADAALVFAALKTHPDPVDIDSSREAWAALIRRLQPDEFGHGGNRVCVPMLSAGELLGLVVLGDRVAGQPFSLQDFDLLKSVSEQASASLLNIRLAQKLAQAKQMEAFQVMSAFFVHELKNTASTLSLMLRNLPLHFGDPQFREDALRGISGTVAHLNDLTSRLSLLRKTVAAKAVESDLNALVVEGLKCLSEAPPFTLVKELRPLPKVLADPEQIQSLVTNLVLNAGEAVSAGGRVEVETSQRNGWVVLLVKDNGCGMTPEFIEDSLFRPFQTTKEKGVGIGMFQCKRIVDAHGGRIEVDSCPGKGTTFRVFLPVARPS